MRRPRHLGEALEANAHVHIWATPIDDRRRADNIASLVARDVDRLPGRRARRDDVLDDQDSFAGVESKSASQRQATAATLGEHGAYVERARHLVSDDQAPESGRQHHLWRPATHAVGHCRAEPRRMIGVLEDQRALEISRAVKTGGQLKVPVEERPALREHVEHLSGSHGRIARRGWFRGSLSIPPCRVEAHREIGDRLARVVDVSVVIIAKNEADNIAGALESVQWIEDVVVVDSGSCDETIEIAKRYTDRVTTRTWDGYGAQKNYATGLAAHDWVLSLDADERVSQELAEEIQALMRSAPPMQGYRIPRTTRYLGRWIRSTDWYPDSQLRLYDRRVARWNARHVHESVRVNGHVGTLRSEMYHYSYRDVADHLSTMNRYTTLSAAQMMADGRRASWVDLIGQPPFVFLRNYLWRQGFRDGLPGLIVSLMNSYYVFCKYAKLWERQTESVRTQD